MDCCWAAGNELGGFIFRDMSRVVSEQLPRPVENFHGIDQRLLLDSEVESPTFVQKFLIPTILSGRNAVICASIGSGKTTGYLLPVFSRILKDGDLGHGDIESGVVCPSVLILTPQQKVSDVHRSCLKLSEGTLIGTAVIAKERDVPDIKNTAVVVTAIGKLQKLRDPDEKICFDRLKIIVLDNVDQMSSHLFNPADYFLEIFPGTNIQVVMITSWLTQNIDRLASKFVRDKYLLCSDHCLGLENVTHHFEEVSGCHYKKLEKIIASDKTEKTIVFAKSDFECRSIASHLSKVGFDPQIVHNGGDVFIGDGHSSLLVAAFGTFDAWREMRFPKVDHVIMFALPSCRLDYCQFISRVQGRRATTLVDPSILLPDQKDVLKKIREMF